MAIVKPFAGLRPTKANAAEVAAPPYDVISSEEAREMAKGHPMSFLHINKPEIDLPENIHLYDDRVYAKAAENFKKFIAEGILVKDKERYFYVYEQQMGKHKQTGLMACVSAEDYKNDIIKKHELTREDKENDRTRHVDVINANAGPVFLTYKAQKSVNAIIGDVVKGTPEYDFTASDGVQHRLWIIKDKAINAKIEAEFAKIPVLYVADGHHRSASAARVADMRKKANPKHTGKEEYNLFLAVIFPHDHLKIIAYNRIVHDLNGHSEADYMKRVKEKFEVTETSSPKPEKHNDVRMYISGKWYKLVPKDGTFKKGDPIESLDVSILQKNLLAPVLGIDDPRKSERISFVGGDESIEIMKKKVDGGKFKVAFSMYPTSVEQLMDIADAGKIMPPKSTWFVPKLRSGVVVHTLD